MTVMRLAEAPWPRRAWRRAAWPIVMLLVLGALLALGAIGAVGLAPSAVLAETRARSERQEPKEFEGDWTVDGNRDDGRVELAFKREWRTPGGRSLWSSSFDVEPSELRGIDADDWKAADAPVRFELAREAGTIRCEGRLRHGQGSGRFTFVPNPEFRAAMERAGFRGISNENLARLCLQGVTLEWIRGFETRGVHIDSLDELIRLQVQGIDSRYIDGMRSAGLRYADVDELVRLKVQGVDPSYVRAITGGLPSVTADEIVRLKVQGVAASFPGDIVDLGFQRPTADELVRLQVQGVSIDYMSQLRDAGYSNATPDEIIRLRIAGVTSSWIREANSKHGHLSVEDLIRLKQQGSL